MDDEITFTLEQALRAQRELRGALGLGDEIFPMPAFVGMISDEIEQMRAAGRSDADVVEIVARATGHTLDLQDLQRFYAPPDARGRPE